MSNPKIEQQQRFWDEHWEQWRDRNTLNEWKDQRHEAIVVGLSALSLHNPKIIDLGCGPGYYTQSLTRFGPTTGLDLSEHAIAKAKSKYPDIEFIAGNLYDYPFPREHYDVVVSQEAFDHVEDQDKFIDRAYELLVPGGYLVLSCTNKFVMDRLQEGDFGALPPEHIKKYLNIREFERILRRRFEILSVTSIIPAGNRGMLRLANSNKVNRALGLVVSRGRLDALKGRLGLGYQLIALARKPR